jgi:hypothetical protein
MAGTPKGFNAARVREGLLIAMNFGLPPEDADQPTFWFPATATITASVDDENVPFDPTVRPTYRRASVTVPCAVEYVDAEGKIENFGVLVRAKVKITLLGDEYEEVRGFEFVTIGGQRYMYKRTEAPLGLGSIPVWTVHCESEDEG